MNKPLLSICIPTYNRAELLRPALLSLLPQVKELGGVVELIVSDNCSTDNTKEVVEWARRYGPVRYSKNEVNIGFMRNILKLTNEMAGGDFCWIVGDDDFVMPEAIHNIIETIKLHGDIDYIFAVESSIDTKIVRELSVRDICVSSKDFMHLAKSKVSVEKRLIKKWETLIDPEIRFDYLGFLPNSIFRTHIWKSVDMNGISGEDFADWKSVYPHVYILGMAYFGKKAIYSGDPLIIMGDGSRDWAGNEGFWSGYLPVIYLSYFDDMISFFHSKGLRGKLYKKCRMAQAIIVGSYLWDFVFLKYSQKIVIPASEQIKLVNIIRYMFYLDFWNVFMPIARPRLSVFIVNRIKRIIRIFKI